LKWVQITNDKYPLRIVIAGGGTGGHLFPGIALAQEFTARNPNNSLLFVGTGKPFETTALSKAGFAHKRITSEGIKGRGLWNQTRSILKIPKGIVESVMILKQFRPDLVMGVGGYSAGPLVAGAWLLGIKIVLHEQNILPGITNRILSRLADRIYVSFDDIPTGFNPRKVLYTGNPVRREILQSATDQKVGEIDDSTQQRRFAILILETNFSLYIRPDSMMKQEWKRHTSGMECPLEFKRFSMIWPGNIKTPILSYAGQEQQQWQKSKRLEGALFSYRFLLLRIITRFLTPVRWKKPVPPK